MIIMQFNKMSLIIAESKSIDVCKIGSQRSNSSNKKRSPKSSKIIQIIELDIDTPPPSKRLCTRQNRRDSSLKVIEIDLTPPSIIKSSQDPKHNEKSNKGIFNSSTPKIKRCRSYATQNGLGTQDDIDISSPIRKIQSFPTTNHNMKLRRTTRKLDSDEQTSEVQLDRSSCNANCERSLNSSRSFLNNQNTSRTPKGSKIGSSELEKATHYVKLQKLFSLLNATEWCDKHIRYFIGSAYRPLYVSNKTEDPSWELLRHETEGMSYNTFFETYTSGMNRGFHTTNDELIELWISILYFLEESISVEQIPSIAINHSILVRGVRKNSNEEVRMMSYSYFERLILFQYPPHTIEAQEFYKKLFIRKNTSFNSEAHPNSEMEMWEFFVELLEDLEAAIICKNNCKNSGSYLIFRLVLLILESDLVSWIRCCSHSIELNVYRPMIATLFWPDGVGSNNKRINKIVTTYLSSLFLCADKKRRRHVRNHSLLNCLYRRLICMIAQMVDIRDKLKEQNEYKEELIKSFTLLLFQQESQICNVPKVAVLWHHLNCLKPDWFSAAISNSLMIHIWKKTCSKYQQDSNNLSNGSLIPLRRNFKQFEEARKIINMKNIHSGFSDKKIDINSKESNELKTYQNTIGPKIESVMLHMQKCEKEAINKQLNGFINVNKRNQYGK